MFDKRPHERGPKNSTPPIFFLHDLGLAGAFWGWRGWPMGRRELSKAGEEPSEAGEKMVAGGCLGGG